MALAEWLGRMPYLRNIGGALLVIVFGAMLSNFGIVPKAEAAPALYGPIFAIVTPAAIFLVLLEASLRALKRAGAPMLIAFAMGAAGTMLGVLAAAQLLPGARAAVGEHFAGIGGMLTGTYIGGSANLNALALAYGVADDGILYAATVVADNVMTTLWIFVTIALPLLLMRSRRFPRRQAVSAEEAERPKPVEGLLAVALPLALALAAILAADWLGGLSGGLVPPILIVTTFALAAAQLPAVERLSLARPLGMAGIYLFLAVIGISADFAALAAAGYVGMLLFAFIAIVFAVHLLVLLAGSALLRIDPDIVAIASNANIGGSATAIALAEVRGRDDLVLAGMLAGTVGTALGTYAGFAVAALL